MAATGRSAFHGFTEGTRYLQRLERRRSYVAVVRRFVVGGALAAFTVGTAIVLGGGP